MYIELIQTSFAFGIETSTAVSSGIMHDHLLHNRNTLETTNDITSLVSVEVIRCWPASILQVFTIDFASTPFDRYGHMVVYIARVRGRFTEKVDLRLVFFNEI